MKNKQSDFLSKALVKFEKEVIQKSAFKNIRIIGGSSLCGENSDIHIIRPLIYPTSGMFEGSSLEYKVSDFRFLHFTSVQNMLSILRSGALRLYDLNHMTDPMEFALGYKFLRDEKRKEILSDHYKSQLFSLSFIQYDEDKLNHNIDLWRFYGYNGNGICLELQVKNFEFLSTWRNWFLGRVSYKRLDDYEENELSKLKMLYEDFLSRNKELTIRNFDEIFLVIMSYYKSEIYKSEDEVRLLRYIKHGYKNQGNPEGIHSDISNNNCLTYYTELPLYSEKRNQHQEEYMSNFQIQPCLKINKIYTGYNIEKWLNIQKVFLDYLFKTFGYSIDVERTPVHKYFRNR